MPEHPTGHENDAGQAIRFMIIKAGIFILVPLVAAVLAALWLV